MQEKNKNSNQPNYHARRLIAAGMAGAALLGVGKAASNWSERVNGAPVEHYQPGNPESEAHFRTVVAKPGDTQWGIAREAVGSKENIDPMLEELNRQAAADGKPGLQIGEELHVPRTPTPSSDRE